MEKILGKFCLIDGERFEIIDEPTSDGWIWISDCDGDIHDAHIDDVEMEE